MRNNTDKPITISLIGTFSVSLLIIITCQCFQLKANNSFSDEIYKQDIIENKLFPGYCTIFSISTGESVFFGNNEDWRNPLTYIWVEPANDENYAVVYLGFDNFFPQGGINEKGLAFDGNALPYIQIDSFPDKLQPKESIVNNIIMRKCATVEEAIDMADSYDWGEIYSGKFAGQYLLADSTGDAVVMSFNSSGKLVFTRKQKSDAYIVSTNFNRAYHENRYGSYPCKRYDLASNMLEQTEKELTIDYLASVLEAVHEEGRKLNTLYSNIFDLKKGIIYLYFWHQFDDVVAINVSEWIENEPDPKRIESLFNVETVNKANTEYKRYKHLKSYLIIAMTIITLVLVISLMKRLYWSKVKSNKK